MKKKIWALYLPVAFLAASCGQSETEYNTKVVGLYSSYTNKLSASMDKILDVENKELAGAELKKLEMMTDSCVTVLNGLKPSEAAADFHKKVLVVFQTAQKQLLPLAARMAAASKADDPSVYNTLADDFNKAHKSISDAEDEARSAQQAYAAKVGADIR